MRRGDASGPSGSVRRRVGVSAGKSAGAVAVVLCGFTLLALWLLWPAVAPNAADRMTIGTIADDFLRQFHPYRAFVARSWASGQIPVWNPHQYAGTPAWADPQLAVLYPWRLLQIPLALGGRTLPVWAVTIEAIGHLALGGVFTYGLVRRLGARSSAAALSGAAFAASGYLTGYPLQQLAVLDTAVWIPATLWALTIALQAEDVIARRKAAILAGGATALGVFAGHPQTATYALVAGLGWILWRSIGAWRSEMGGAPLRTGSEIAAIWLVSGIGLSAAQWWPTLEFSRAVSRAPEWEELLAGLPARDLIQIAAPHAISCFSPLHVGAVALALSVWGLVRAPAARPWILLAAVGWLVSLGGNGPIVPALFKLAPALAIFRHQERIAVLVALGLAVAAGLALETILSGSSKASDLRSDDDSALDEASGAGPERAAASVSAASAARTAGALALGAGIAGAMLYVAPAGEALAATCRPDVVPGPLSLALADGFVRTALGAGMLALVLARLAAGGLGRRSAGFAIVAIAVLELVSVHRGRALAPVQDDAGAVFARTPIVEALIERARDGRISSEALLPGGPNAASVHGLYDVTGDSPLHLAAVANMVEDAPEMVWWRLFGVRYLLTQREIGEAEAGVLSEIVRDGDLVLYEVQLPAPPAWSARAQVEPDWMPEPDFDPLRLVVLDALPENGQDSLHVDGLEGDASDASSRQPPQDVRLTGLEVGGATVVTNLTEPSAVVLSSAHDPGGGWKARARSSDGQMLDPLVMRAYGTLQAVSLPAGEWTIEWSYRPSAILRGTLASAVTLLLALAYALGASRWRRKLEAVG